MLLVPNILDIPAPAILPLVPRPTHSVIIPIESAVRGGYFSDLHPRPARGAAGHGDVGRFVGGPLTRLEGGPIR